MKTLPDYFITQGDFGMAYQTTLKDHQGLVDLSVALDVQFQMWLPEISLATLITGVATILDQGLYLGQVQYLFKDGDTDIPGTWWAEWQVNFGSPLEVVTFPNPHKNVVQIVPAGSPSPV